MATLSYNDDIAPLKGDHFGRPISTRMSEYLYEEYDKPMMQMQAQELAARTANLRYQQAAEENRRRRQEADHIAEVSSTLSEGINSDMSSFDKVQFINRTRQSLFSKAPLVAGSSLFNGLFNSALQSVQGTQAQQDRLMPQMTEAARLGNVPAAKEIAGMDGIVTPKEEATIVQAEAQSQSDSQRLRTTLATKKRAAEAALLKDDISQVRGFGDMTSAGISDDAEIGSASMEDVFFLNKSEIMRMQGIADRQLAGTKELETYNTTDFFDAASRKSFLLNALGIKAANYLADMPEMTTPAPAGGHAGSPAGGHAGSHFLK
tara:strand:+ start:1580 stop:2536 length:957 start_codon:yes stop_codon:yes gene_type:complete